MPLADELVFIGAVQLWENCLVRLIDHVLDLSNLSVLRVTFFSIEHGVNRLDHGYNLQVLCSSFLGRNLESIMVSSTST